LLSFLSTQLSLAIPLHCVYCDFWLGSWVKIFGSRSTLLRQLLHNTRFSNGFIGVFHLYRHQPLSLPTSTHQSVACTRQGVCFPFWRVVVTFLPPSFTWPCCWRFSTAPGGLCWREVFQWWRLVFTRRQW
jgi:hypothetical protein